MPGAPRQISPLAAARWDAKRAVAVGMIAGYVDTVGYLMLQGLFPNHVTGNLPMAAADPGAHAIPALLMVPWWLVAVILAAAAAGRIKRRNPALVLPSIFGVEAVLLALLVISGVVLIPSPHTSTVLPQTVVCAAGVAAMAVQSVVTRLGGYAYPTTMVTGTLSLLGMDSAAAIFRLHPEGERAAILRRIRAFSRVVVAFAVGAGLGGLIGLRLNFWAITLPMLAVVACAIAEYRVGPGTSPQDQAQVLA